MKTKPSESERWSAMERIFLHLLTETFGLQHCEIAEIKNGKELIRPAQHVFYDKDLANFWHFTPEELSSEIKAAAAKEL